FFFSSRRRHTRFSRDWSSDVCSSDLRAAFGGCLVKRGAANGDDLLGIRCFDGGDGVAGVNWPGKRVFAFNRENVGNLHHVEQGCDARCDVFAGGGRRRQERVMAVHQCDDQRSDIFRKLVGKRSVIRNMHGADTGNLGNLFADTGTAGADDESMDFAKLGSGGYNGQRCVFHVCVVMFNKYERFHYMGPTALSLAISASTSSTVSPACRTGGSVTLVVVRRGAMSTP